MSEEGLMKKLYQIGAIKFGEFTLKSGKKSPYYVDLRILPSFPSVLVEVGKVMGQIIRDSTLELTRLCGIPAAGLAIATMCGVETGIPVIYTRKEPIIYKDLATRLNNDVREGKFKQDEIPGAKKAIEVIEDLSGLKTHGITRYVDGELQSRDRIAIIDDLITTADSKLEARDLILLEAKRKNIEVDVTAVFVLLDREQGGRQMLEENGVRFFSAITVSDVADCLFHSGILDAERYKIITDYTLSERISG